jgi:itaconate CoA-transferase
MVWERGSLRPCWVPSRHAVVPRFTSGTAVTTPRMDTHFLVTEYGSVNLKGKSTRERALDVISLAHPRFRDDLLQEAENMRLL